MAIFANILLPLPLSNPVYTYIVESSEEQEELVGKLAEIPFGKGKKYTGVILSTSDALPHAPGKIAYKKVLQIYPYPPIPPHILKLWQWASNFYLCSLGEVYAAAVPSGFRPDAKQSDELQRPTKLLTGWRIVERLFTSPQWQNSLYKDFQKSHAVTRALDKILAEYQAAELPPLSLADLAEWLGVSSSVVTKLRKAHLLEEGAIPLSDARASTLSSGESDPLSEQIFFGSRSILLLHAEECSLQERIPFAYLRNQVAEDKQVLLLFPSEEQLELTLPTLEATFDSTLFPYYSKTSTTLRERYWLNALEGKPGLYIGLRSAVWLPFAHLQLATILDEEDRNYRQYEPAPRFTATQLMLMLATYSGAKSLLLSSTPSVESFMQSINQKYSYKHYTPTREMPRLIDVRSIDLPKAFEENRVQGRLLSFEMMDAIRQSLEEGTPALLFYQRKGYAKWARCTHCNDQPKCPKCHTVYRYFQQRRQLVCGMCGHHEPLPQLCPSCHRPTLTLEGTGIERIHSALQGLYRGATIKMDGQPLPKGSPAPQIILSSSYTPPYKLLQQVSTIGILQLDLLTTLPHFRANEEAYAFLTHCRDEAPQLRRMIVQYLAPHQNALEAFTKKQYRTMLDHELEARHLIGFPPFARHIDIYFESAAQEAAFKLATQFAQALRQQLPDCTILDPSPLPLRKALSTIGYKVTLLSSLTHSTTKLHPLIRQMLLYYTEQYRGPKLHAYFDVSPL